MNENCLKVSYGNSRTEPSRCLPILAVFMSIRINSSSLPETPEAPLYLVVRLSSESTAQLASEPELLELRELRLFPYRISTDGFCVDMPSKQAQSGDFCSSYKLVRFIQHRGCKLSLLPYHRNPAPTRAQLS